MEATVLAREFQRQFKTKYNYYPYSMKNVQESKWWNHFTEFCSTSKLGDDEEKFVKQLFESWDSNDKLFPYVLSQKYAKDIESNMLENSGVETKKLSDSDYIRITLMKAAHWATKNHVQNNKIGNFLKDPACQALALRGEYYKPLFFFSKSFLEKYSLTEEDELKKNSIRAFHPLLYISLKSSLAEDFVD